MILSNINLQSITIWLDKWIHLYYGKKPRKSHFAKQTTETKTIRITIFHHRCREMKISYLGYLSFIAHREFLYILPKQKLHMSVWPKVIPLKTRNQKKVKNSKHFSYVDIRSFSNFQLFLFWYFKKKSK